MNVLFSKVVLIPIIIVLITILLCIVSKKIILKLFNFKTKASNEGKQKTIINLINNIVRFFIVAVAFLIILENFNIDTKSLVASLGIISLVAGLALQDILKDFIVGISIIFEGQFSIGDIVSINGFKGEVLASNLRTTKIKAYTGEVKFISNRNITEIINYSFNKAISFIDISVSYDSNLDLVKQVLDELCINLSDKGKHIECLGVQDLNDSSIAFRIVVEATYGNHFELARTLRKEIVCNLKNNNIEIPYPQVVVHNGKKL